MAIQQIVDTVQQKEREMEKETQLEKARAEKMRVEIDRERVKIDVAREQQELERAKAAAAREQQELEKVRGENIRMTLMHAVQDTEDEGDANEDALLLLQYRNGGLVT